MIPAEARLQPSKVRYDDFRPMPPDSADTPPPDIALGESQRSAIRLRVDLSPDMFLETARDTYSQFPAFHHNTGGHSRGRGSN